MADRTASSRAERYNEKMKAAGKRKIQVWVDESDLNMLGYAGVSVQSALSMSAKMVSPYADSELKSRRINMLLSSIGEDTIAVERDIFGMCINAEIKKVINATKQLQGFKEDSSALLYIISKVPTLIYSEARKIIEEEYNDRISKTKSKEYEKRLEQIKLHLIDELYDIVYLEKTECSPEESFLKKYCSGYVEKNQYKHDPEFIEKFNKSCKEKWEFQEAFDAEKLSEPVKECEISRKDISSVMTPQTPEAVIAREDAANGKKKKSRKKKNSSSKA